MFKRRMVGLAMRWLGESNSSELKAEQLHMDLGCSILHVASHVKVGEVQVRKEQGIVCQEVVGGESKITAFNVEFPNMNSFRRELHATHIYGNSGGAFNEMHMVVGGVYEVDLINEEHSNMILCRSDKYATHINGNIGGVNEANIIN